MDETRTGMRSKVRGVSAACLAVALASCVGSGDWTTVAGPLLRADAGAPSMPGSVGDASIGQGDSRTAASTVDSDAGTPSVDLPSQPWVHVPDSGAPNERWSPPPGATDTGPTKTLSTSSAVIAINIAQPGDRGDPSRTWYEELDGDLDDEVCTSVDDEETGCRYVSCEGVSVDCGDESEFEGVLLIQFMPDDTYTIILFGADQCDSEKDAPACSYDAKGNELRCGTWFGAVVEPSQSGAEKR